MEKWIFAITSIIVFKLTLSFEITQYCRKKTLIMGGEEFVCHNATLELFQNPNLFLSNIHKLTCENCTLPTLNESTFNVTKNSINFLYLTSSTIHTIKEFAFSKFRLLRVLNLRNNTVTELEPKCFTNLKRMAQLDLSYNNIRILINSIFEELPNLNLLNLNHNHIYYFQPDAFKGLEHLRHLYLNNNEIKKLDGHIFKYMPNLLLLYLEDNQIVEIDSFAFTNLSSLNSLYLNRNNLSFLTQYNFKPLTNLADLQLRNNNLTEIQTSSFNGLSNLKYLYLGKNRLKTVKRYGFVGLDNLQYLELNNNEFEIFELDFIKHAKNLRMLWLQYNHISNLSIDFKLEPLHSLNSLGINDNNMTILNYKLIHEKIPNLRDIFIYNNTWECEHLVNMFEFFQERNVSLCASDNCSVNRTKQLIQESCPPEATEDVTEDIGDFVTEVAAYVRISVFLIVISQMLVLV